MSIEEQLKNDLKDAMRARDTQKSNVVKMLRSKVTEARTAKGFSGEVDDELYKKVIAAYQKQMKKAIESYASAGDSAKEQVAELQYEIDYCAQFLPKQLGEEEIKQIVTAKQEELGISDPKMTGRLVGAVMKDYKGQVDAGVVKAVAEKLLS